MADLPFNMLVLLFAGSFTIGILGIVLALKQIAGAPFVTVFAGILIFGIMATTKVIDVGYSDPQPSNTTQSGGIETCTVSGSTTTCTPTAITKSFSYKNSTNILTNRPDPIPQQYNINQENMWVYMVFLGVFWIFLGLMMQLTRWHI